MNRGSELRTKIRKIAGTHESDNVEYAIGTVIAINPNDGFLKNTCQVKLVSSKSINGDSSVFDSPISIPNIDASGHPISDAQKKSITDQYTGLILNNVALSVNTSDKESLTIPEIGSQVVVLMSRYQQPFITQFSKILYNETHYGTAIAYSGRNLKGDNGFQWSVIDDTRSGKNSFFGIQPDPNDKAHSLFEVVSKTIEIGTKTGTASLNAPRMIMANDIIGLYNNNSGIELNQNGHILITSPNTITIKNPMTDLNSILHNILDLIISLSNSGGPCVPANPTAYTQILAQINSLLG